MTNPPFTQPEPATTTLGDAVAPPANNKSRKKLILNTVILFAVAGFIGFALYLWATTSPAAAKVGDCVSRTGAEGVEVAGCGEANAEYKVVGRVEDKTETEAGISACTPFEKDGAEASFWQGEQGEKGLVLCLAPNKK